MNKLYWTWNFVHYTIYGWEQSIQKIFNYPIVKFVSWAPIRKLYAKRGVVDPASEIINVTISGKTNPSIIIAGIQMGGLIVMIEYSLFNFLQAYLKTSLIQYIFENIFILIAWLFVLLLVAGLINYYILFKRDKYLDYFKRFNKLDKKSKNKNRWISTLIIIGVIGMLILSFKIWITRGF
jgi:hypothetical protein